ncbi:MULTISPECIES: S41 family peptidase [unclassified Janthinobacterium]|uniref:S41 family peptidase n=1 Tax=unclassified Janthinobacterium TaxID=2610881 RepID=UPI0018C9E00B|nr:S41 family peptidase [Janthinobacterium sp. CG_23.4]MDH6156263.1 C-terminal processing protease CtpA/Prc [Janthinobacterium sp. CG_23.4]
MAMQWMAQWMALKNGCARRVLAGVLGALAVLVCIAAPAQAHDGNSVALARLWSAARATHPALADDRVDWDRALVAALPKLRDEDDEASLRLAIATLMAPLRDQALRIGADTPRYVRWPADGEVLEWLPGDTALLHLHPGMVDGSPLLLPARARQVILDLRARRELARPPLPTMLHAVLAQLITEPLLLPAERYRFSTGPRPSTPGQWEGMTAGFMQLEAQRLQPAPGARALPMVFIVNDTQSVPYAVLALQRTGRARIVAEEGAWRSRAGPLQALSIGDDLRVEFASGQLAWPDGSAAVLAADRTLRMDRATGPASAPVQAALALLAQPLQPAQASRPKLLTPASAALFPVRHDDEAYRDMRLPEREWRMLAAIKLWATLDNYFPAKRLMSSSWDDALQRCLHQMAQVHDARAYGLILQQMAASLDDSHVGVGSRALGGNSRTHGIGVVLAAIDEGIVVANVTEPALLRSGLLKVGDAIVQIDGEYVGTRLARLRAATAASNEAGRWRKAMAEMLTFLPGVSVTLQVDGSDGKRREVVLQPTPLDDALAPRHARPMIALDKGIAYVDLDRLQTGEVDAMFDQIQGSRALILDMRGYPHGTGRAIAARLNVNDASVFAMFYQQLVTAHETSDGVQLAYPDRLYPALAPVYRGQVVMLINEHTQSQAEHLALAVEAATPVTFIGTPSAGANGDLREVVLPGNVHVWYSGLEVRHADGRQLQRVGVQPHITVAPSVAGLRAGRDEVLERAQVFLRKDQE